MDGSGTHLHLVAVAGDCRFLIDGAAVVAVRLRAAEDESCADVPLVDLNQLFGGAQPVEEALAPLGLARGLVIACGENGRVQLRLAAARIDGSVPLTGADLAPLPPLSADSADLFDAVTRDPVDGSFLLRLRLDPVRLRRFAS